MNMRGRTNANHNKTVNTSTPISFVLTNRKISNNSSFPSSALLFLNCKNYSKITITEIMHFNNNKCDIYYSCYSDSDLEENGSSLYYVSGGHKLSAYVGQNIAVSNYDLIRIELLGTYDATTQVHFTMS